MSFEVTAAENFSGPTHEAISLQAMYGQRFQPKEEKKYRSMIQINTERQSSITGCKILFQARNEVDKFKKNFAVLEVMGCPRFMERHWLRMSEIVGEHQFQLSSCFDNESISNISLRGQKRSTDSSRKNVRCSI